jgi:hypothetical protein
MKYSRARTLLAVAALLGSLSCSKATPVAPSGSLLTLSANPGRISSPTGTTTITAVAVKPSGQPVNPGTQIHFDTTLGTIDPVASTNNSGSASVTLRGDGRVGMATVHASTGSIAAVMIMVQIGSPAGSVTLQASPSGVPESGGSITLTALVRDDAGSPLPGVNVNFSSQIGTLKSKGNFVPTDPSGVARDTLTVTAADISTLGANSFNVTVQAAGAMGALMTQTFMVAIERAPVASFTFTATRLTVVFTDTSQPKPTSWFWDFGDGSHSTTENPVHTYAVAGSYAVTLTATNALGSTSTSQVVTVTAQ